MVQSCSDQAIHRQQCWFCDCYCRIRVAFELIGNLAQTSVQYCERSFTETSENRDCTTTQLAQFFEQYQRDPDSLFFIDESGPRSKLIRGQPQVTQSPTLRVSLSTKRPGQKLLRLLRFVPQAHLEVWVTFFCQVLNDLIYVVDFRRPDSVRDSPLNSLMLRALVQQTRVLIATAPVLTESNDLRGLYDFTPDQWYALFQAFSDDVNALRKFHQQHGKKKPDFGALLGIDIDDECRTVWKRDGTKPKKHVLTAATWDLFRVLMQAGPDGTTRRSVAKKLAISEQAVSTRKNALKQSLFPICLTIPGKEFRLEKLR